MLFNLSESYFFSTATIFLVHDYAKIQLFLLQNG